MPVLQPGAALNGDIRRSKEVSERLVQDVRQGVHARQVMESYQIWFGEGPELSILRILALRGLWRYSLVTDKLSATMKIAKRVYSDDRSLPCFGSHVLLSGRFRVCETKRDCRCSNLAFRRRRVSG